MFNSNFFLSQPDDLLHSHGTLRGRTGTTYCPSRSVSPGSSPSLRTSAPVLSVNDLAAQFAGQRIERRAQVCYDSCDSYANTNNDAAGWAIPPAADTTPGLNDLDVEAVASMAERSFATRVLAASRDRAQTAYVSSSRRAHRQSSTRLLCSSTGHHREIAALVARMVEQQDQCHLTSPSALSSSCPSTPTIDEDAISSPTLSASPAPSSPLHDDEGYDTASWSSRRSSSSFYSHQRHVSKHGSTGSTKSLNRGEYRRSSDFSASVTGAYVRKMPRVRREHVSTGANGASRIRKGSGITKT